MMITIILLLFMIIGCVGAAILLGTTFDNLKTVPIKKIPAIICIVICTLQFLIGTIGILHLFSVSSEKDAEKAEYELIHEPVYKKVK